MPSRNPYTVSEAFPSPAGPVVGMCGRFELHETQSLYTSLSVRSQVLSGSLTPALVSGQTFQVIASLVQPQAEQ